MDGNAFKAHDFPFGIWSGVQFTLGDRYMNE